MKARLIFHNSSNRRLILLFSGWSTTPALYEGLYTEGWDIMLVYDYSTPDFDASVIDAYSTIYIIAWSLGVTAAEKAAKAGLDVNRVSAAFAINGTVTPAHDKEGIPTTIYDGTILSLSKPNLQRFRRRMSRSYDPYAFPADTPFAIDEESEEEALIRLRKELQILRNGTNQSVMPWKRAYVSVNDLIFPHINQLTSWNNQPIPPQTVKVDAGHYIPLQGIINEVTPNYSKIGDRFRRAVSTYDDNAVAQNRIARHLADMLDRVNSSSVPINADMLEIGPGSGRLTRYIGERINPKKATFIDLYPLRPFHIAQEEEYVICDAEEWLENANANSYDLVVSGSTMQWFADPDRFFGNVAKTLRSGGVFLCSTFLPGNLNELDILRPSPLIYRSKDELLSMLKRYFNDVTAEDETIPMDFNSPRDALMHLKLTGVGGGSKALAHNLLTSLPKHPRLTYRTLYILAKNH